ncbi:MAG: SpoIVB peptidase [Clostridia bacterium]|nr:SpoIVB peptidase [Clostridia bacterium]
MKKIFNIKVLITAVFVFLIIGGAAIVSSIPDEIILFEDENLNLGKIFTVDAQTDSGGILRGNEMDYSNDNYFAEVKLAGVLPVKTVKVEVIETPEVVPCGNSIGVKIYADGLIVVGISNFPSNDGRMVSPAGEGGIKAGDIIKEVNGQAVSNASEFSEFVEKSAGGAVTVTVERNGARYKYNLTPCKDSNDDLKLGIWVRSSIAGIGTMTFYCPDDNSYGALGHGITDSDTGKIVPVGKGEVLIADIVSIRKGERGSPGELRGTFIADSVIGDVEQNTECGIYGKVSTINAFKGETVQAASRSEVVEGKAQILTCIDGEEVAEYDIEIQKVTHRKNVDTKCMIIKVTDPVLLSETGGILQGMSGSPILQNGKLIGAVTHVFVNDPTRGYGIFIENMIVEAEKIE